jgi:23S rRNA pseudouridine955/2504/2580 synthase
VKGRLFDRVVIVMLCAVSDHLVRVFGASPLVAEHVAQVASSYPERGVSARLAQLRFGVDKSILSPAEASELVAEQPEFLECAFSSVYEDEHIVATNKPWDALLSSDAKGPRWDGELSLRDWLKQEHPDTMTEDGEEVRLCHNLDFATSGVIVAAKSRLAADAVSRAFRDREARKLYVALVLGHPTWDTTRWEQRIMPSKRRFRQRISKGGKSATTIAHVGARGTLRIGEHRGEDASLLFLEPLTGRRHRASRAGRILLNTPLPSHMLMVSSFDSRVPQSSVSTARMLGMASSAT